VAVNPINLVLGPARLYVAAYGTTAPLDSAVTPNGPTNPPSAPWADVGATDGGIMFAIEGTYTDLICDQVIMPIGARLTDLKASITTKLSEMTLSNLSTAMNQIMATGGGSGYATSDLTVTNAATQPTYAAAIIDGWAPTLSTGAAALRRVVVPKFLSTPKITMTYDRKGQQSYDVALNIFYVSSSVNPVHLVDQLA
jgi:hypothetical protein